MGVKIIVGLAAVFIGLVSVCAIVALALDEPSSAEPFESSSRLASELGCDFIAAEYRAVAPYLGREGGVQNVQASANLKLGANQHVFYGEAESAVDECVSE